jgi:hypothetical protein
LFHFNQLAIFFQGFQVTCITDDIFAMGLFSNHHNKTLEIKGLNTVVFQVAISHIFNHLHSSFNLSGNLLDCSSPIVSKNSSKVKCIHHFQAIFFIVFLILVIPFDLGQIIPFSFGTSWKYIIACHSFIFVSFSFFQIIQSPVHQMLKDISLSILIKYFSESSYIAKLFSIISLTIATGSKSSEISNCSLFET